MRATDVTDIIPCNTPYASSSDHGEDVIGENLPNISNDNVYITHAKFVFGANDCHRRDQEPLLPNYPHRRHR